MKTKTKKVKVKYLAKGVPDFFSNKLKRGTIYEVNGNEFTEMKNDK